MASQSYTSLYWQRFDPRGALVVIWRFAMPEDQTKALSLIAAYRFGAENALATQVTDIRTMAIDGVRYKPGVRRGYIAQLFREKNLLEPFINQHWAFARTPEGERKLRYYERLRNRHLQLMRGVDEEIEPETIDVEDSEESEQGFALEAGLRDFLANNLSVLEPGLQLYTSDTRKGVEFPIDQGFIDILAVDRSRKFVVIELKLSHGRNKALGQLLYYMGWVDEHLGSKPCRGMIIAEDITDALITAARRVPGISLFHYRVAMSVQPVSLSPNGET